MTNLKQALFNELNLNIECAENRLRELRREASRHLEAISPDQHDNLVTVVGIVVGILALQDDLHRERHRLSVLGQ